MVSFHCTSNKITSSNGDQQRNPLKNLILSCCCCPLCLPFFSLAPVKFCYCKKITGRCFFDIAHKNCSLNQKRVKSNGNILAKPKAIFLSEKKLFKRICV